MHKIPRSPFKKHRKSRARAPKSAANNNVKALRTAVQFNTKRNHHTRVIIPSEAIFALRQYLGMTQGSFAAQLGVTEPCVSWWECKRRSPNRQLSEKLRELAAMNGVDLEKLVDQKYYQEQARVRVFVGIVPEAKTEKETVQA